MSRSTLTTYSLPPARPYRSLGPRSEVRLQRVQRFRKERPQQLYGTIWPGISQPAQAVQQHCGSLSLRRTSWASNGAPTMSSLHLLERFELLRMTPPNKELKLCRMLGTRLGSSFKSDICGLVFFSGFLAFLHCIASASTQRMISGIKNV